MTSFFYYRRIAYSLGCLLAIASLYFFGVYPNYKDSLQLTQQIETVKRQIEMQRFFEPIYKKLLARQQRTDLNGLKYPPKVAPAKPKDLKHFNILMGDIARNNEMTLRRIIPDANAYLSTSKLLGMNITLEGDFFHFRQLLLHLCYIPFLQDLETIRIYTGEPKHTFDLRVVLVQE